MTNEKSSESRRKLLKSIAAGGGAVIAGKSLPESWSRPVVDSVILPAHAVTSLFTYFGLNLPRQRPIADSGERGSLFANLMEATITEAHAQRNLPGMSVEVNGGMATVRFLSSDEDNIHSAVAPINGAPSGIPVLDPLSCFDPNGECGADFCGPVSVQILGYSIGDPTIRVRVNSAAVEGPTGWETEVSMAPIGPLVLAACE
jgi:hypothetical protein